MTATAAQIAQLRRMIAEPSAPTSTYADADLQAVIETYPTVDARGEDPMIESTTTPGTLMINPFWLPTYDMHAAAAAVWEEKAAALAANFDFSADGGQYSRSQGYQQAMQMVRFHLARRNPGTITMRMKPDLTNRSWQDIIGNLPEQDRP